VHYIVVVILLMIGLFIVITSRNLIKKIIGLGIFQAAILLFYISLGKVYKAVPPIILANDPVDKLYSSPLPQVLMLTAIVVGIATLAVAMSFIIKINENFDSIDEEEIISKIKEDEFTS